MYKNIILISGKARSGKDYISDQLKDAITKENKTVYKFALADLLKEYLCTLFDLSLDELNLLKNTEEPFTKNGLSMRQLLQKMGTDIFCNKIDEHFWVKNAAKIIAKTDYDFYIISDFRYQFELNIIDYACGYSNNYVRSDTYSMTTVRINNQEQIKSNTHKSETSLDNFNFDVIINNIDYTYKFNLNDFKLHI